MPFPNYPQKYQSQPLVTPQQSKAHKEQHADGELPDPPEAVILCYSRRLLEYFLEHYDGQRIDHYYGTLYAFDETDRTVGVLGDFGIGAPVTAMLMEELIADGVETFLSIGLAGCLDDTIDLGEFVVCNGAIRDEGVSHHYVTPAKYIRPSDRLLSRTRRVLTDRQIQFHVGPSWTIDAIYRETEAEVRQYAAEGVLTVEMEAATVFTVAASQGVDAGAMFVVSDYLDPTGWEPLFHLSIQEKSLDRLGDLAIQVLSTRDR